MPSPRLTPAAIRSCAKSGTIDRILIEGGDGTIVSKGQPLFKVTPDEKFVETDPKEIEKEQRARTSEYLQAVL